MPKKKIVSVFVIGILFQLSVGGQTVAWENNIIGVGTFASPRAWDLNGDGVKDVILGDGSEQDSIGHLTAYDGVTGDQLWSIERSGELFTSPQFFRINEDDIYDIIMGGRLANLFCVDGSNGNLIWEFDTTQASPGGQGWLQFYEPQTITDVTGDGIRDLVVINGGDVAALPGQQDRKPGHLLLLDATDGSVLHQAVMPDSAESYSSLVLTEVANESETYIYFGTGGETLKGSVWRADLTQLMGDDITGADELIGGTFKGFVAPPVLADLTSDNVLDIIAAGSDGTMTMVNGASLVTEWSFSDPGFETYSTPGIGDFNGDGQLDVIGNYGHGEWPLFDYSVQVMFDGNDGTILRIDTIGMQFSSILTYDVDQDGKDEAILPYAAVNYSTGISSAGQAIINEDNGVQTMFVNPGTTNFASTSCLDDLDGDGDLELIEVHSINPMNQYSLRVWNTGFQVNAPLRWTAYRGTYFDGIYHVDSTVTSESVVEELNDVRVISDSDAMEILFQNTPQWIRLTDVAGRIDQQLWSCGFNCYSINNVSTGLYLLTYQTENQKATVKLFVP